ncbi:hypothetical protein IQ251_14475 [Saccharopolyspora sp. HNM0983]|uniref:Uncharacterized protein n=1 Tax=Saccharopolyspora montiporae TaxID=2781240 RepID=A0A929BC54_9PSEU|nr:hypothetical protein [Saccharopolyspora sp. HNM0983]
MGLLDVFRGIKRPDSDAPVLPADQVRAAILAINRPTAPFIIREGGDDEPDLIAEWRVVDAEWRQVFAKAGLTKAFRVKMRLDPDNAEVRAVDEEWAVKWAQGIPKFSAAAFRGRKVEHQWSSQAAFTERGELGVVYKYRFNPGEMKKPIKKAVTGSGWMWRGVAFAKL